MKPASLVSLIAELNKLPGVSKKDAEKIAYYLVKEPLIKSENLTRAINDVKNKLRSCAICNNYTEQAECNICLDKSRQKILVVVESPLDIYKFEDAQTIRPYYHVLGGLVNLNRKLEITDLNVKTLKERAKKFNEVILALSPNLEGIVTANYLRQMLSGVKVTQLAQGIPLGAAMEYVDEITLKAALDNRKEVK